MRWGEGKCKGRWEKCGGGVKNVLGGGEVDVEKGVRVWRRAGGGEKGCGKVCWSVGKVKGDVGKWGK